MISTLFDVPHESPQVLLIENGDLIYDQSHFGIAFDHIVEALNQGRKTGD
jgi:bacillithiol system protein YtxJ